MDEEVYILTAKQLSEMKAFPSVDELIPPSMNAITRLEIIHHEKCTYCNGKGRYIGGNMFAAPINCKVCGGSGFKGREHIFTDSKKTVKASVQDDGRTLKLFISDREQSK